VRIHHVGTTPYRLEHVEWTHTSPTYTISFMPSDYVVGADIDTIAGRPVFDGGGTQEWFFELHSSNGEPTNLRFYYLRIQNYTSGGIAFVGAESPAARAFWNGYNTVYGCYFYRLGDKYDPTARDTGIGALDLGNSDHNLIRNNFFAYLENRPATLTHIHGVYLAHGSDYNVIVKNDFSKITGDPIKVRDYSNFNQILSNAFTRTGQVAFFRDAPSAGECGSWRNEFRSNTLWCGYSGGAIKVFMDSPDPNLPRGRQGSLCPAVPEWLYTSGNEKICP
jgi:hypothetical protein